MDSQAKEALKQKISIASVSVVGGGIAWWIVLAAVLGWVSPTTAAQHTSDAVQAKVDQALAPFCVQSMMANKTGMAEFAKADGAYSRDEVVQKAVPKIGITKVDYALSDVCATDVAAKLKSAARKPAVKTPTKS